MNRLKMLWKCFFSHGRLCPKCGQKRIPWRDGSWACWKCDLTQQNTQAYKEVGIQ